MDKKSLDEKLVSLQQQFDGLTKQKTEAEAEIFRLQGEYRAIQGIISTLDEPKQEETTKEVKSGK